MAAVLVALGAAAVCSLRPPAPVGPDAPAQAFSAERAMAHVRSMAQRPHPMGSPEHARVRAYVITTLQGLGFTVERQAATGVRAPGNDPRTRGPVVGGSVENLMVRLAGTASTGAVLLASHYDAVPAGPGAADDAAAAAAVLEAMRALRAGPRLRNDVIALFTDGEENGLIGAEAFVSAHPWARAVRVVLNFEARGTRGPVHLYETTAGNGPVVREWARGVPWPVGTSLGYEVYKRLPNDTDFTEFKRLHAVGLNFAFIDGVEAYHTPLDSAEALDRGSVQAHGDSALALARRFGQADLDRSRWRGPDAVFFTLPGGLVVRYPASWAIPFACATLLAWGWAVLRARRRGETSIGGLVVALLVLGVFGAVEIWAALRASGWLERLQAWWHPLAAPTTNGAYALALTAIAVLDWLVVYVLLRKKLAAHSLALGAGLIVLAGSGALAVLVPGASYLSAWPVLAAIGATAVLHTGGDRRAGGTGRVLALGLLAVPALAILVPTSLGLVSGLGLTREGVVALEVLLWVLVATLLPQVEALTEGRRWWPASLALLVAAGALVAGGATAPYGPSHPRPVNVLYALDADTGRAVWATAAGPVDDWLAQFVTMTPRRGAPPGLAALATWDRALYREAPVIEVPAPTAVLTDSADDGSGRVLGVRLASPRGARTLSVRLPGREVLGARVNGRPAASPDGTAGWAAGRWGLDYTNVPADGIDLAIRVKGHGPITLVLTDRSDGLPAVPGRTFAPRPSWSMPIHRGDGTLVQKRFEF